VKSENIAAVDIPRRAARESDIADFRRARARMKLRRINIARALAERFSRRARKHFEECCRDKAAVF